MYHLIRLNKPTIQEQTTILPWQFMSHTGDKILPANKHVVPYG